MEVSVNQAIPFFKDMSNGDNRWLLWNSMEEDSSSVTSDKPSKPLGLGNMYAIYHKCWHIFGKTICLMVKSLLKCGHLIKEINKQILF